MIMVVPDVADDNRDVPTVRLVVRGTMVLSMMVLNMTLMIFLFLVSLLVWL